MRRIFYIIGILVVILLGVLLQHYFCCCSYTAKSKDNSVATAVPVATGTMATTAKGNLHDFSIKDGNLALTSAENFSFAPSSYELIKPIGSDLKAKVEQMKAYSQEHPDKNLTVTGYYADFEENNSVFPNLGLARANAVKGYLVESGLDGRRIHLNGSATDEIKEGVSPLKGIVGYEVNVLDEEALAVKRQELMTFGDELRQAPVRVYFKSGSASINLSQEERNKVNKIADYLDEVEDGRILVVGHTDKSGDSKKNEVLGLKRAELVKDYLVRNGFSASVIEVTSMGERQPIADNSTAEGKAKNRRVEITLK